MYLVFDVGGTNSRVAFSPDGQMIDEPIVWKTGQEFESGITELVNNMERAIGGRQAVAIAGGLPGVVDRTKKMLLKSPHLSGWENKTVGKRIEQKFGVSVKIENDAAMAALGEATSGAGRKYGIVAYVTVSTGIGGAVVIHGKLGERTYSFEPGHQIIDYEGTVGYLEQFASGTAIEKMYGKKPEEITDESVYEGVERVLTIGLNNLCVMWSPEVIILGGSISKSLNPDRIKALLTEQLTIFPKVPDILRAELGYKCGLYGALQLLK